MADYQNLILQLLARSKQPVSVTSIAESLALADPPPRKRALEALGKLMQKKLVERANKQTGFKPVEPEYQTTKAGRDFIASGKRVTSGPNGPLAGVRKGPDNTFRQRLWNAFRIQKKATLPQLIEIAREKRDGNVEANALKFLKSLVRAGVAARMPTREKGHALTSPGHVRFALVRDLGPRAPQAANRHLVNLNATDDVDRFIPYGESK